MEFDDDFKPRLRPLEAFPVPGGAGEGELGLRDPSGLSDAAISLSGAALHVVSMMDGTNTCQDILDKFQETVGTGLPSETLQAMVKQLEQAHFLDGQGFESYRESLLKEYRGNPVRDLSATSALRAEGVSGPLFDEMLSLAEPTPLPGSAVGLVAPHLDYARGAPCYAAAYSTLRGQAAPDRVVILGTNHFGQSRSVVATASHYQTPLGTTKTDVEFLQRLETQCGDLRSFELDHAREHSVELQVAWLQHLFGVDSFTMVPLLCPDPTGPTGTAPVDGNGVDLRDFAEALRAILAEDHQETLIVAGADLSHAGAAFGDSRSLDPEFLDEIRARDSRALQSLEAEGAAGWIECIATDGNPTQICSAGCVFVLASVLPDSTCKMLRYHQAVDQQAQTCVTCAALALH